MRVPSGLVRLDEDTPKPDPREVLVRIRASSLNFGDLMILIFIGLTEAARIWTVTSCGPGAGKVKSSSFISSGPP